MFHFKRPRRGVHLFGYVFSPRLIPTLGVLLVLPILLCLGQWQLHRAQEKRTLEQEFKRQGVLTLERLEEHTPTSLRYRRLEMRGYFDNAHVLLLDNKIYQHQIGYHVFSPFRPTHSTSVLLVDRGFIAAKNRTQLPIIPPVEGERMLRGLIYFPTKMWVLKQERAKQTWPQVLQTIDLAHIGKQLDLPLYPFYLLLEQGDSSPLVRDWHPVNFPSYRHTGYAIQWYSLAFTLVLIYLILNTKKRNPL